jgi:hypothetical protein
MYTAPRQTKPAAARAQPASQVQKRVRQSAPTGLSQAQQAAAGGSQQQPAASQAARRGGGADHEQ